MAFQDAEVETLTRLGLTHRQAKVYLALARSGNATVKTVSNVSEIPRQHIYQVVSTLQELGLVEKAITSPVKFKAIPVPDGLSILMERKSKEYNELQAKTIYMLKHSTRNNAKATPKEEEPQFVIIPARDSTDRYVRKLIEATQTSFDGLISMNGLKGVYIYADFFKRALKRGVKCRHIITIPEGEKSVTGIDPAFKKKPNFEIRYILTPTPASVTLYDKKEALVSTVSTDPIEAPGLWSSNPSFVGILNNYFEEMWIRALEEIPEKH